MNKIQLIDTLPNVFLSRSDIMSDIWQQKVTFEKGGVRKTVGASDYQSVADFDDWQNSFSIWF